MLDHLQEEQLQHDSRAHREILSLRVPDKMRHFTLHLAKYCGRLARPENRICTLRATAVDAFIVGLATCNALGFDVAKSMNQPSVSSTQEKPAPPLDLQVGSIADQYFSDLVDITGRMAKVCESFDHLEAIAYRQILTAAAIELCQITMLLYEGIGEDLEAAVRRRWADVEGHG